MPEPKTVTADLLSLYKPNVPTGNFLPDATRRGGNAMLSTILVRLDLLDRPSVEREFRRMDDEAHARSQAVIDQMQQERASASTHQGPCA